MERQNGGSDLKDPLEGYSGLSLFPRTLASLPNPPKPYDPDDLNHTHNFLKSMPLQSPNRLLEEAKVIVAGSPEVVNSKVMPSNAAASNNKDEVVAAAAKVMENPRRERRPGLGLKRAPFSFKPRNSSQPAVTLEEPDIAKLKDPVEFFKAFERFENAKRELQRLRGGVSMEPDPNTSFNVAPRPRPRREGILGRMRTVKYRHLYPRLTSSQDTFEEDSFNPLDQSLQQETINPNVASPERDLTGSIAKSEKRVNELLEELLTRDYEELHGDGAVTLLQDRLQIKPIELEKFCLPDLENIPRIDFKASGGQSRKPRNALTDIHNMLKGIRSSKTPTKHINAESLASPTPPKSPLASISMLKKRILQSNPLSDPFSAHDIDLFSAHDIDQSPARNASPIENINQQSDQVDTGKELSISKELKSLMIEVNDIAVANMSSPEVAVGDFAGPSDKYVNDNSSRLGFGVDVGSSGSHANMQDNNGDSSMDHEVANENLSRPDVDDDADVRTSGPNELDDKVEDMLQEARPFARPDINMEDSTVENLDNIHSQLADQSSPTATEDHAMDGNSKTADSGSEQHNEKVQESSRVPPNERSKTISRPRKERKSKGLSRGQSLGATEDQAMDGLFNTADSGSEQHIEKVQESSRVPPNERSKAISRPRKERKNKGLSRRQSLVATEDHAMDGLFNTADGSEQHNEKVQESSRVPRNERSEAISRPRKKHKREGLFSRRQSLAASGTSFESGVRRSTRITSRPLEYWNGERFLYGRIHESLPTVIGIKYESPAKDDGKPTIRVKSFVSDEYKELVEQAALH